MKQLPGWALSAKFLPGEDFYVHVMSPQNDGLTKETAA